MNDSNIKKQKRKKYIEVVILLVRIYKYKLKYKKLMYEHISRNSNCGNTCNSYF